MFEEANRILVDETMQSRLPRTQALPNNPSHPLRSEPGKELLLYLSISEGALSSMLVKEDRKIQRPIYFVSKVLQGPEIRYQKIEKLALALVTATRKLKAQSLFLESSNHSVDQSTDQAGAPEARTLRQNDRMVNEAFRI